jgi:hypothetical protein
MFRTPAAGQHSVSASLFGGCGQRNAANELLQAIADRRRQADELEPDAGWLTPAHRWLGMPYPQCNLEAAPAGGLDLAALDDPPDRKQAAVQGPLQ